MMKTGFSLLAGTGLLLLSGFAHSAPPQTNYHEVKKIELGGEGGWDYLTFDGDAQRLYVSHTNVVVVVDVAKGAKVGEIPGTTGVHGIALAPKLNRGFTSNGRDNSVTLFDLKTLKVLDTVKVGKNPDCILFDPATNRVFTFNGNGADATAIDAATGKVAGTIPLEGRPEFAVTDGKGEIFVNIEDKSEIVALDAKALTVKHRWPIAPGEEPSGLAMDVAHRRLFAVCSNEKMVVMDADSGKVVATPTVGKGPDASAFDPGLGLAYSSNGQDGTLTLVHEDAPNTFRVAATVPTQRGARTMALDPKTHHVFLATARFKAPAAGTPAGRRPAMEPNSFMILVYAP